MSESNVTIIEPDRASKQNSSETSSNYWI